VTVRHIWRHFVAVRLWTTLCTDAPLYWPFDGPSLGQFFSLRPRETDLPAQRAPAQAQARIPCSHGHACGSRDSQEPPRQGPEASFRVATVQRRHRLSRSRDFDAVYRQGRSTSTRFLVLYWFDREDDPSEPRLGLAVPKAAGNAVARNKIKRQLREIWSGRLERVPAGRDYVLIAKPGLSEAVEANGFGWLGERVDEVLQKVAA
jgi:ribonuclease P protein component